MRSADARSPIGRALVPLLVLGAWLVPAETLAARASAVAAGDSHTCAVTSRGGVKCWGHNSTGQLGDGTTTTRSTPADVTGLTSGVAAVSAGANHTCALTTGGGLKCWGYNSSGQVGDGTTSGRRTPSDVAGLASGVAAVAAGAEHTCALTTGGGVKCWGDNSSGRLGDGTTAARSAPADVTGLTGGAAAVAAGAYHTCALMAGGGVKCWGANFSGQLGDGTTTSRTTPTDVSGLSTGIAALAARGQRTCALTSRGGVKCWGANWSGQLGDGTTSARTAPTDVLGLTTGVASVAAGDEHTCAVMAAGGVECWGDNASGQVGDGTTTTRLTPTGVVGLASGAVATAAGAAHTCAVTPGGGIRCWGRNPNGERGEGTAAARSAPTDVAGLGSGVAAVAAGGFHGCALRPAAVWRVGAATTSARWATGPGQAA